ncbi:hypothetical protein LOK49_LG13G02547 [Camellia lanceoleosa]|uniref:Uncharacterized protein n=2 Tax=Camellia lanceoleosa TaxID=1840588 RepID=A0ACC0FIE2_9ERIC|nr:hypothetical protein LOK49_LG13G02567 [Camellia lanceoleosa]KAI7988927.1 hypothetical protein LOK49_LG13G02547 [Camellia lanceoleosa]
MGFHCSKHMAIEEYIKKNILTSPPFKLDYRGLLKYINHTLPQPKSPPIKFLQQSLLLLHQLLSSFFFFLFSRKHEQARRLELPVMPTPQLPEKRLVSTLFRAKNWREG